MQPDIARIEESLIAICAHIRKMRALNNRTDSWWSWATVTFHHAPGLDDGVIDLLGNPQDDTPLSAHAAMASKALEAKIFQEGHSILDEIVKCPVLNYQGLELRVIVNKPDEEDGHFRIEFFLDCFKLGGDGEPIEKICKMLTSILAAFAKIPEEALQGHMRAFTCNEAPSDDELHTAPSPEAMILKRHFLGWKTTGVKEHLRTPQIKRNLRRMIDEQEAASSSRTAPSS